MIHYHGPQFLVRKPRDLNFIENTDFDYDPFFIDDFIQTFIDIQYFLNIKKILIRYIVIIYRGSSFSFRRPRNLFYSRGLPDYCHGPLGFMWASLGNTDFNYDQFFH